MFMSYEQIQRAVVRLQRSWPPRDFDLTKTRTSSGLDFLLRDTNCSAPWDHESTSPPDSFPQAQAITTWHNQVQVNLTRLHPLALLLRETDLFIFPPSEWVNITHNKISFMLTCTSFAGEDVFSLTTSNTLTGEMCNVAKYSVVSFHCVCAGWWGIVLVFMLGFFFFCCGCVFHGWLQVWPTLSLVKNMNFPFIHNPPSSLSHLRATYSL